VAPHRTLLTWTDALDVVLAACATLPSEEIALADALGRTVAEEIRAPENVPPFANSAMDGFAVRAADLAAGPRVLPCAVAGPAGTAPPPLPSGHAAPIATGAPVPEGADTIVPVEDTESRDGGVLLPGPVATGRHVRNAGSDVRAGELLLVPGDHIGAAEGSVLAALGLTTVRAHRAPRVAIIATGSELVPANLTPGPAQIRESNSTAIAWACRTAGALPRFIGIARDDEAALRTLFAEGLAEADVVVSSGGVSVGERDLVRGILENLRVESRIEAVRLKPGKPLAFGVHGSTLVFGLPGNPASAQVGMALFVRPALLALSGRRDPRPILWPAVAGGEWPAPADRDHAVRCRLSVANGSLVATPTGDQGSHRIASMIGAHGLAIVEAGHRLTPGDPLGVVRLDA
jgi:molybdopterin molybdotransferase